MTEEDSSEDITELAEQAKIVAKATGRDETDVMADLLDDGVVNLSNEKTMSRDLVTELKEAAELINTVKGINQEVSDNRVLNGGENTTEVKVETTLEGDIVDRAIASVERKAEKLRKIAVILAPILLLLSGGLGVDYFLENGEEGSYDDDYAIEIWGCMNTDALNYDETANEDDGSCVFEPPPCINSWLYEDNSHEGEGGIIIEFTFYDDHDCGTEIDGHFIITLYSNGSQIEDVFVNVGHFTDSVDVNYEFTDLDAGTYNVSIELHELACETGACEHAEEWTMEQNPTFTVEDEVEGCVPKLNYYDLDLGADANSLTLYVDFQDENGCQETDLEMRVELFWNGESYHFMDWGAHGGLEPIRDSEVNYELQEDFMTGLNDGDWYVEWSARVVNNDNSNYEVEEQTNTVTIDEIPDEPDKCEINLFWIDIATNSTHASVGYDLDCGYEDNDLEGYNVSVQFLVYEVNGTSGGPNATGPIVYDTNLHFIQGWVEDNNYITLTNFTESNDTHYDFYFYAIWEDGNGDGQMMERKWLNRELNP